MATDYIPFQPDENSAPPFRFQGSAAEGLLTFSLTWNMAGERWYLRVQDSHGETLLYRPLIGSPPDQSINLIRTISRSQLVFREKNNVFEITP